MAEKLELETLSTTEYLELGALTAEDEDLRNERVKYMIELSQLKQIPLPKLMEELGLKPLTHGR